MEWFIAVYVVPLFHFVQCFSGACVPVYFPFGG